MRQVSDGIHISKPELLELIQGTEDVERTAAIAKHLDSCSACRAALDALTAPAELWEKMASNLKSYTSELSGGSRSPDDGWIGKTAELFESPRHPELLGSLGKYDIECEIGRGGMGVVFKAIDPELHRTVAIKILAPQFANHTLARTRFAQEAIAAAGIFHPNVISVHNVHTDGKFPYLVMPYVDGTSLQRLVEQDGTLTELEIVQIALQIAAGLTAAHAQGIVHRDIKPANILIDSNLNRIMITDFGLARAADDASMTQTGWLMGTPNYMSPEQARGERADQRSDLFSTGSVLYFLATGQLPFQAATTLGVLQRIQHDKPIPVRRLNNKLSETFSKLIDKLLAKAPALRFASARELSIFLEQHLAYLKMPQANRPPQIRRFVSIESKALKRWLASGAICMLLASGAGYFGYPKGPANAPQPQAVQQNLESCQLLSLAKRKVADGDLVDAEELCRKAFQADPTNDDAATNLGYILALQGKHREAFEWHERAANSQDFRAVGNYNLACFYSTQNDHERAFIHLEKSIQCGLSRYCSVRDLQDDKDLDNVRQDERFTVALQQLAVASQTIPH